MISDGGTKAFLSSIFSELVLPKREFIWTAAFLYVLTGLGVAEPAARRGIARAAESGWLENNRVGREARWWLTDSGLAIVDEITDRTTSLQFQDDHWGGRCIILSIVIPSDKKNARRRLYNALSWAGFGNPMPGLWASPHVDRFVEVRQVIRELGLRDSTACFVGGTVEGGLSDREIVERAWNLREVSDRYKETLRTFDRRNPRDGDDVLFSYLSLVTEWRKFPYIDPQLPSDLLPNWIGKRALATFTELRNRWRPGALQRWEEIVEQTKPGR